jgi:hypothetical protein
MPSENAHWEWERKLMALAEDLPVSVALARGMVRKCPTCGILHAGIRFMHEDHRDYCSGCCFRERAER